MDRSTLVVGLFTIGMGVAILLAALDLVPVDEASFHAPRWVVGAAGCAASLVGGLVLLSLVSPGTTPAETGIESLVDRMRQAGALMVFVLMAAIANWIAFGPGERAFSGSVSLPFLALALPSSEVIGRFVFGVGAVSLDVILILIVFRGLRGGTDADGG